MSRQYWKDWYGEDGASDEDEGREDLTSQTWDEDRCQWIYGAQIEQKKDWVDWQDPDCGKTPPITTSPTTPAGRGKPIPAWRETLDQACWQREIPSISVLAAISADSLQPVDDIPMKSNHDPIKNVSFDSAAVPLACIMEEPEKFYGQRVAIILTGGNLDLDQLPW